MSHDNLTAGVIGTGVLGRNHARIYASLEDVAGLCVYDMDARRASAVASDCGAIVCHTTEELLERSDVVSVCTPASNHFEVSSAAFDAGVHVLVEKPISVDSHSAAAMVERANARGCVLQVGHIERFNGAFEAASSLLRKPHFIEAHRLGTFTPRGTDVSVVVDLMIHDIDLVLCVLGGETVKELRASGTAVLTDSMDIVNARIEFENGCTANLTASRISREPMRKIRFFEENLYVSADLRGRSVEAFRKEEGVTADRIEADPLAFIRPIDVDVDDGEPLRKEIRAFIDAVRSGCPPPVTGREGLRAIEIAERVIECTGGEGAAR